MHSVICIASHLNSPLLLLVAMDKDKEDSYSLTEKGEVALGTMLRAVSEDPEKFGVSKGVVGQIGRIAVGELCVVQINQECFPFACLRTKLSDILPSYDFVYSRYNTIGATVTSRKTDIAHVYATSRSFFDVDGDVLVRHDSRALMTSFGKNIIRTEWISDQNVQRGGESFQVGDGEMYPVCNKFRIIRDTSEIDGCSTHP